MGHYNSHREYDLNRSGDRKSGALKLIGIMVTWALLGSCGGGGGGSNSGGGGGNGGSPTLLPCNVLAQGSVYDPAFNDGFIYQVAVDSTNVYWYDKESTNSGTIKSVPKNGGTVTILAAGLGGVQFFVVDDTSVYWGEHNFGSGAGMIRSVPKGGGTIVTLASGIPPGQVNDVFDPQRVAVDIDYVYWSDFGIRRVPKMGGMVTNIINDTVAYDFALDSSTNPSTVYFFKGDPNSPKDAFGNPTTGIYYSTPIAGGAVKTLASAPLGSFGGFFVDQTSLYNVSLTTSQVYSVPLSGGPVNTLITAGPNPHNLATDGTYLYFGGMNHFTKIPKTGGVATTYQGCVVPTDTKTFYGLAWFAADTNNVYAVASPGGPGSGPIAIIKVPAF